MNEFLRRAAGSLKRISERIGMRSRVAVPGTIEPAAWKREFVKLEESGHGTWEEERIYYRGALVFSKTWLHVHGSSMVKAEHGNKRMAEAAELARAYADMVTAFDLLAAQRALLSTEVRMEEKTYQALLGHPQFNDARQKFMGLKCFFFVRHLGGSEYLVTRA